MAYWNKIKKIVYIHPYKTGGSSVRKILPVVGPGQGVDEGQEIIGKHARLDQVEAWFKLTGQWAEYESCIVFATIRNPYDWFVSLYEFFRNRPGHELHKIVVRMDFVSYIEYYKSYMMRGQLFEHHLQSEFVCKHGGSIYEQPNTKIQLIKMEELDKVPVLLDMNVQMPHENTIDHPSFQEYYTPQIMKKCDFLKKESEIFGYDVKLFS